MTHLFYSAKAPPTAFMVCLRKPDLDTLAAAFLAGVQPDFNPLLVCLGDAPEHLLRNPSVLCLECGGSGQTHLANLDHHGGNEILPTAVEQAMDLFWPAQNSLYTDRLHILAEYAAFIDSAGQRGTPPLYSSPANLSALVSGMLSMHKTPEEAFRAGLKLLEQWVDTAAAPWDLTKVVSDFPVWRHYLAAHTVMRNALRADARHVVPFSTAIGPALALCSGSYGVHGLLRNLGAKVRLAVGLGHPYRYSISVEPKDKPWLQVLGNNLNAMEPGWGGPSGGSILGAPFPGSRLELATVIELMTHNPLHI